MGLGFIGAGGGILLLLGVFFLTIISLFFLVDGILCVFQKRTTPAGLRLILALMFGFYPTKTILYFYRCAEAEKTRKQDFYLTASLSSSGEYLIRVDGTENPDELILLQGEITFEISFPHAKPLKGRCGSINSRRIDGGFGSLILSKIDINNPDSSEYFADFIPRLPNTKYNYENDAYRVYYRKTGINFDQLTISRKRK